MTLVSPSVLQGSNMKERSDNVLDISEQDSLLLSAYLDGELSERKCRALENRLEKGEAGLQEALDRLRDLRQGIRGWFQESLAEDRDREGPVDLWSKISADIQRAPVRPSLREQVAEFLLGGAVLRPQVLGPMVASMLLIAVGVSLWPDSSVTQSSTVGASCSVSLQ